MENHVSEEEVRRLIGNRLEQDETRRVTVHLLSGCSQCRPHLAALAGALKELEDAEAEKAVGLDESLYDEPIDRAIAAVLEREVPRWEQERKELDRLVARGTSWALSRPRRREKGWPVVEALLELSAAERFRDRGLMLHFSFGAMLVARQLDPGVYGKALVADFKARATAEHANSCRLNNQFREAESYLAEADALAEEGTGDLLLAGRLVDLQGSLWMDQRRLGDALERFDLAETIYREIGETHLAGRALISKGVAKGFEGSPQEAVRYLREGIGQIAKEQDPRLAVMARHDLLFALVDCGEYREASRMLLKSGLREAFAAEPVNLLRLRWLEAKILAGRNRLGQAERAFREVQEGFLARSEEYDASLVGLELSGVLLAGEGREAEVQELAAEIYEVFRSLDIHREAVRAMRYFRETCRRHEATPALVRQIVEFVRRLEWQPHMRFAPAAAD